MVLFSKVNSFQYIVVPFEFSPLERKPSLEVHVCNQKFPLGVWEGLWLVIVALPGLFTYYYFFFLRQ